MPRTLSFPPPSTATCPICSARLSDPRCGTCGASFAGEDGATLWRVDHDLFDLCRIRNDVVHRLLTDAAASSPAAPPPPIPHPGDPSPADPAASVRPGPPPADPLPGGAGPVPVRPGPPPADPLPHEAGPTPGRHEPVPHAVRPGSPPADQPSGADPLLGGAGPVPSAPAASPRPGSPVAARPSVVDPARTGPDPVSSPGAPAAARSGAAVDGGPSGGDRTDPWSVDRWAPSSAPDPDGGPGQASITPPPGPGGRPPRPRPSFTAAEVLVGLGALSLVAAVAVFAAVSWSDLAAWAQGALVVGLTGFVLGAAVAGRRRDLVATSESLGAVGVALGLADVQVVRVGLDGLAPDRGVWAVGVALVAVGTVALGRRSGIRVLGLAGRALAFAPLVVATSGGRPLAALGALAVQAVVGGVVATRRADLRSDRVVAGVGAALSWCGAVAGSLALAGAGLAADPVATPGGPAVVLTALAVASIVAARRLRTRVAPAVADLVGGAGVALALGPALLVAIGSGSILAVLAVVGVQGVLALGWSGDERSTGGERVAAAVGGAACWTGAVLGLLGLAGARLIDGDPVTGPALVLAAVVVGSLVAARIRPALAALAAAGTAVAFAPGLLLAAGTGSVVTVLAVAAGQAVVALAVAGRLAVAERPVAEAGGWVLGVGAAAGALLQVAVALATVPHEPGRRAGALFVLAGLAVASIGVGRTSARSSVTAAGVGLAFGPVPLVVLGVVTPTVLVAMLLGEALVAALLVAVVGRGPVRTVLTAGGATVWAVAVVGATALGLVGWSDAPVRGPAGAVALLVALAALAGGASVTGGRDTTAAGVGLGAAVVPLLLAVALAAGGLGPDGWVAAVLAAAAVMALGLGVLGRVDERRPWVAPSSVALVVGVALAVVPARTVLGVAAALVDRATGDPGVGGSVVVADWLRPALDATGLAVPGWATVAQMAGAAVLAGSVAGRHRRTGRALGALVAVSTVVVVPVATGLTVAVTVAGLGLVAAALAAVVRLRPRDPELLVGAAATVLVGTGFAAGAAPWAVGWSVLVGLAVALLAAEVVARRSPDAPVWVGTAVGVGLAGVALDAWMLGASAVGGLLAVAVAATALAPGAVVLERRGLAVAAGVVDVMVALALVSAPLVAVAVTGTVLSLSPFLVLAGVTAAGAALRPSRRSAWLVATGSAVLLAWVEVARADVTVVEAYTVPLAAWVLLVGAVARGDGGAGRPLGSWERYGIGLLTAAGPTTLLAVLDPDPVRTVGIVALGAAAAIWGAAARLQAPLAVGTAAVAVLAVRHLGPVGVELPRYVAFAVAGLVLLAVGATFEQRRQDLRHARDAFVRLR